MNIRQSQAVYLCPNCHGEDQSFTSGTPGSAVCSMFCHGCGHSESHVIPGSTPYGPLNPRCKVTVGNYVKQAPKPTEIPIRDRVPPPPPPYAAMSVQPSKPVVEKFVAMENAMDIIEVDEETRWDFI